MEWFLFAEIKEIIYIEKSFLECSNAHICPKHNANIVFDEINPQDINVLMPIRSRVFTIKWPQWLMDECGPFKVIDIGVDWTGLGNPFRSDSLNEKTEPPFSPETKEMGFGKRLLKLVLTCTSYSKMATILLFFCFLANWLFFPHFQT